MLPWATSTLSSLALRARVRSSIFEQTRLRSVRTLKITAALFPFFPPLFFNSIHGRASFHRSRRPNRCFKFFALVAVARDFVTSVLYDMLRSHRSVFREVEDYRAYRRSHPRVHH